MDFDLEKIRQLIDLMNANDLQELEVHDDGKKIRLRKTEDKEIVAIPTAPVAAAPVAAPVAGVPPAAPAANGAPSDNGMVNIPSPMVGTFYRSPNPEADPFVEVGDRVRPDSVMCIIEAMKVMNEILADVEGVLQEILVANGEAVEFGQPLFVVKADVTE